MQTSINLQGPFTYSIIALIIAIILTILGTCYLIYLKKVKKEEKQVNEVKVIPEKNIKDIPAIKGKYLGQLDSIEYKYQNQMIELRKAYQQISEIIRMFVFEVTDITTQNYSLAEIKKLNIPNLYGLIEEYYEPEFASKTVGDFIASINKARRVVNEWN